VYRQGVVRTTLADIANAADVPVGNVYYYFKTKDDIIGAVVRAHRERLEASLAELEARHRSPKARLKALGDMLADQQEDVARYGCPYGTLSSELAKQADDPDPLAATLLSLQIEWAEKQLRALGQRNAANLAVELVAALQGSTVVSHILGRPEIMAQQTRRVHRWIDALGNDANA
jgi:TetR/AcrR family transcriptional regulator, transcriptional repressor for nem operon